MGAGSVVRKIVNFTTSIKMMFPEVVSKILHANIRDLEFVGQGVQIWEFEQI